MKTHTILSGVVVAILAFASIQTICNAEDRDYRLRRIQDPIAELELWMRRSCAGRQLLRALTQESAAGVVPGLQMLALELERIVSDAVGQLVDSSDPRLLAATKDLRSLPRRTACDDPVIAVMAIADGWARRVGGGDDRIHGGVVGSVRRFTGRNGDARALLARMYPELHEEAIRVLALLS